MSQPSAAAEARARLRARFEATPRLVQQVLASPPPALPFDPRALRRIRTTGIGASESCARALAWLLAERLALDARFTPVGMLASGGLPDCERDALVVFSQGLAPNARFALQAPERWRGMLLVTASTPAGAGPERAAWLAALESAGAGIVRFPPENEYDSLVRVQGPLCGLAAALGIARAVAQACGLASALEHAAPADVAARIASADAALERALSEVAPDALARRFTFLASGGYGALVTNLQQKLLEGLLRPFPPVWDVLDFAHGAFQQGYDETRCFLALLRADADDEGTWMERVAQILAPARHALVPLRASLPGIYALFEHEALCDALMLRQQEAEDLDPASWPGRGRDGPLYTAEPESLPAPAPESASLPARANAAGSELAARVWPEMEAALAQGACAVVPLGAVEQHGPHLPFATDAWIADALAARVCARWTGAVALPAVPFGCSPEHADFPGTLALRSETLTALLADLVASLARHGFASVFLFSAHGGNAAPLRDALPRLREAASAAAREHGRPAPRIVAHTDLAGLTGALQRAAAAHGIGAAEAGHHAGEVETSILLALRPGAVRRDAFAPGRLEARADAQDLFYPSLRANAPSGTVGDPRPADAARGARYLEAWTDELLACIREGLRA